MKIDEKMGKTLIPDITFMANPVAANIIGISFPVLVDCLHHRKNILSTNDEEGLQEFWMKVQSYTDDQTFINILLDKIVFIKSYGDFFIEENQLIGKFTIQSKTYQLVVTLLDNKITFENSFEGRQFSGLYKKLPSGKSLIQYKDKTTNVLDLKDRKTFYDRYQMLIESYNEDGIQESRYTKETRDNYCIMNETGEKILQYSGPFGNYTEKQFDYREENNMILSRFIKKYVPSGLENQSRNRDRFLIGKNVDPDSKKLLIGENFTWYDKELHEKYLNHEVSIDEVWNLRAEAYQKKKML